MSRYLKEVVQHTKNIVRVKANSIDKALKTYAAEANAEFIERDDFNESDDEEFENPGKLMSIKERIKIKDTMRIQSEKLENVQFLSKVRSNEYFDAGHDYLKAKSSGPVKIFKQTYSNDSSEEKRSRNSSLVKKSIVTDLMSVSTQNAYEGLKQVIYPKPEESSSKTYSTKIVRFE